jgi:MFS family permease
MGLSAGNFGVRFWSLIGATFLGFLGIGTVLPGLAPHVRHDLGGSDQTVGFVIGTFSCVALASRFLSGPLADRRGRKVAFISGLISCAFAGGAYLLPIGVASAYAGRFLQGFGEACLYTGAAAWVVEISGVERSAQALGFLSSGIWGGISAGPVIGTWLGSFNRAAEFQIIAALVAAGTLMLVKEDFQPEPHPHGRPMVPRSLIAPGLAIGFINMHYPVITGFLILHLARHGNSGPAAFSAYAGVILLSRFFLGGLPDRMQPAITFYFGIVAMAVGLSGIALGPSPAVAIGMTALLGFGFSFPWSAVASVVLKRTPPGARGSAVSVLSAFYDLFVGISSFAAGTIAGHFGYPAAFWMATAALSCSALAGWFVFGVKEVTATEPISGMELVTEGIDVG